MVEKTAKICDVCKKRIVMDNPKFYGEDICLKCSKEVEPEGLVFTTESYY